MDEYTSSAYDDLVDQTMDDVWGHYIDRSTVPAPYTPIEGVLENQLRTLELKLKEFGRLMDYATEQTRLIVQEKEKIEKLLIFMRPEPDPEKEDPYLTGAVTLTEALEMISEEEAEEREAQAVEEERREKMETFLERHTYKYNRRITAEQILEFAKADPNPGEITAIEFNKKYPEYNEAYIRKTLADLTEMGFLIHDGHVWPNAKREPRMKNGAKGPGRAAKLFKLNGDLLEDFLTRPTNGTTENSETSVQEKETSSPKKIVLHVDTFV